MTVNLSYLDDLSRVRISISGFPNGSVSVERSLNQLLWTVVRGGVALPVVDGSAQLYDYEFASDVANFYRVAQASLEENVDVFTASGTWNKPIGLVAAWVRVWGPGGSGGGCAATAGAADAEGGGGGSGGYAERWIPADLLGDTEPVTVGIGGAGAAAGGNGNAGSGPSSFGAHVSASAGGGGEAGTDSGGGSTVALGGTGGSGVDGDANFPGANGGPGRVISGESVRLNYGAAAPFGAIAIDSSGSGAGLSGRFPGGGSSGARRVTAGSALGSADGAAGLVVVTHIFAG
jgi:hypothetical protein